MPGIDDLIKCQLCNSTFKDPYTLPCFHTFCKTCINANMNSGKMTCKICDKMTSVPGGNIDKAFKPSQLAGFLLLLKTDKFEGVSSEDNSKEMEGVCGECAPPPNKKTPPDAPPPPSVKLSKCYHCNKTMCDNCKNKHYEQMKQETVKNLEKFQDGSQSIRITAEQLNDERKKKIGENAKLKGEITKKHSELLEKLKGEEQKLHKEVDEEIKEIESKIKDSEKEVFQLKAHSETAASLKQKLLSESDEKKRAEICLGIGKIHQEWLENLKGQSAKADPSKETKLVYDAPKYKEGALGKLDHKKGSKVKQAQIPGEKSSVCTII